FESSGDELPRTVVSKNESKNRRLAVVNKILDEMDDVINPKSSTSRHRDSVTGYGGGHMMSRTTERDMSPYQGHRNLPSSGYNSDSGRPPLVSPLRNLTSPDLFVPVSNRTNDDDDDYAYQRTPSSSTQIMYATTNYTAARPQELSFSKNDKIKILNKESHLLWYAEHVPTGARGYVSPNRVHISARDAYSPSPKATVSNTDRRFISEVPRLDNSSRRVQQKRMFGQGNRFYNPKDGTYANVPFVPVHVEKFQGKRRYGTDVLIANWFEDRSKSHDSNYLHDTTYRIEYPAYEGCLPDTSLRRKLLLSQEERSGRMIYGHHNIDDRKQLITSYDEHYNRRGPYGHERFPDERKWALQNDCWLPEHSDHPLQGEPTRLGPIAKQQNAERHPIHINRTENHPFHRSKTLPDISEYTDRYIPHERRLYAESKRVGLERIYSTALDQTNATNKDINYRSITNSSKRQPTTRDAKEIDYLRAYQRDKSIPRTYYYLGKVPDAVTDKMRENYPFLPSPLNSIEQIKSSTIEQLPNQQEQTVYS
ncbi:unnamed protein product, partial [Adineta ricciae]